MLFTNTTLQIESVEQKWGILKHCLLGAIGDECEPVSLPCNLGKVIEAGSHNDITIGFTKTARLRINRGTSNKLFMILKTHDTDGNKRDGKAFVLKTRHDGIVLYSRGNGIDTTVCPTIAWHDYLLGVQENFSIVRLQKCSGNETIFYIVADGVVYSSTPFDLKETCESLKIDMPCTINPSTGECVDAEWLEI